jgi:dolichol-phosphate mannosyltransferase
MRIARKRFGLGVRRWVVFNLVGLTGIGVQVTALTGLVAGGVAYLPATALAVEAAVLNNFVWHERWTWKDRSGGASGEIIGRLARFNLTVGVLSIAQNVVFMKLLVGHLAVHYLPANLVSIVLCALVNFLISDRVVFRRRGRVGEAGAEVTATR